MLAQNNNSESISNDLWIQQQYELVGAANKWLLRSIQQSTQKTAQRKGGKPLEVPQDKLVTLFNHP